MAGYTRQDTSDNIADTKTINAADLDAEFDAVEAAFNNSTGHTHDGTAAEGAPIEVTGPNQEYLSEAAQFRPKTDDTYDLGSATFQWKDLYVDGTANIDSLVADTANIDGGTIDNAVIGGTTPAAGSFTTVSATSNITVGGTVDGRDVAADGTKLDGIEAGADVTDTANVTAAGALMDSELTNIAAVKALDQGVSTTDSPSFSNVYVGYGSAAAPSFAFEGDTNTGLYRSSANELSISTNGVERMRVDSSGDVGIGTATPSSPLHVASSGTGAEDIFRVSSGGGGSFQIRCEDLAAADPTWSLRTFANEPIAFKIATTEAMRIDNSGNVGIGTSSPGAELDVVGGLRSTASGNYNEIITTSIGDGVLNNNGNNWLVVKNGVPADAMRITSNGNVGIGTTSPTSPLDVNGDVTITDKIIHSGDTNTSIRFPANDTFTVETANSERMRIDINGNVGINTVSPSSKLEVKGDVTITDKIIHSGDTNTFISFPASNTFTVETAGSERMRIDGSGNVGIGTTSPSEKLDVNGTIRATSITVTGNVDGRDVSVDGAKLDTIETNADVTDTANVTAAGALMDSELTNIAAVKALDQGVATTDSPTFAAITVTGNVDGRDVSVDGAKLDTIETNADVTDTANVTAAGALMDSELTNIAAVKALNQGVATTDSPTFAGLTLSGTLNFDSADFSVGAVTPTITGSIVAPSAVTYLGQAGRYIRVGNLMFVQLYLGVTSVIGGSGVGVIGGLPGTPAFTGITSYSANVGFASGHGSAVVRTGLFTQASGGIILYDASNTAINLSDYPTSDVYISVFYEVS